MPPRADDAHRRLFSTPHFMNFEEREFLHSDRVDADVVVDRITSISAVIGAPAGVREQVLTDIRALVGPRSIDFPMRTVVIVGDRA